MKRRQKQTALIIVMALFIGLFSAIPAQAATAIKIYNYSTGKTITYKDKQLKYLCNGAIAPISNTPGILENGYSLASYEELFQYYYAIDCQLDESTEELTMSHNDIEIVLTLGSKTAYVNGEAKDMGVAPVKVKYLADNTEKILVPTRFVAETFGINYSYRGANSTVTMNKKTTLTYDSEKQTYAGVYGKIYCDGKFNENHNVPVVQLSNTVMVSAEAVLKDGLRMDYMYDSDSRTLNMKKGDITLQMTVGSTIAYVNDEVVDSGMAPTVVRFEEYGKESILVPIFFISQIFNYDYTWNSESKVGEIHTTEQTGIWENSILNHIINDSDMDNTSHLSSLEKFFNSKPVETYFKISEDTISSTYKQAIKNMNDESITDSRQSNAYASLTNISVVENVMQDTEAYSIQFTDKIYNVENLGFNENDLLVLRIPNTACSERLYDTKGKLIKGISTTTSQTTGDTEIQIKLASVQSNYDISLSDDKMSVIITAYQNYLTDVVYGKNDYGLEFLQFTSLFPTEPEIKDNNNVVIMVEDVMNPLGNVTESISDADGINQIKLSSISNQSFRINLSTNDGYSIMYTEAEGNQLTVYISKQKLIPEIDSAWNVIGSFDFKLPKSVEFSDVILEDRYYDRQIVLTMPGSHEDFYIENPIYCTYEVVTNIKVKERTNDTTDIIVTTDLVQGFRLIDQGEHVTLKMARPDAFYEKIVVLDAGHGGIDPGAVKNNVNEKELALKVLNYTDEYFEDSDIKVYFTRVDDTLIDLYDRAAFATEVAADFFVSLHMNANNSSSANGTGVYYSTKNASKTESGLTSIIMATTFSKNLSAAINTKNNGAQKGDFVVVRDTQVPAVLIELAFMTNSSDFKKLTNQNTQKVAAETIYNTIVELFEEYPVYR